MSKKELTQRLKALYDEISPLIEAFTSEVCPHCRSVCCRQKHAIYEEEDISFLQELGLPYLPPSPAVPLDAPCEFLTSHGCKKPRWQRPFRCTWYFCEDLLQYMPQRAARQYRKMVTLLQEIIQIRRKLSGSATDF